MSNWKSRCRERKGASLNFWNSSVWPRAWDHLSASQHTLECAQICDRGWMTGKPAGCGYAPNFFTHHSFMRRVRHRLGLFTNRPRSIRPWLCWAERAREMLIRLYCEMAIDELINNGWQVFTSTCFDWGLQVYLIFYLIQYLLFHIYKLFKQGNK